MNADIERIRRREILTAAKKLFCTLGYDGTSVDSIAAEAGISKGLVYHYFASKEAILLSFSGEMEEYLNSLLVLDDPLEALRRFGVDFLVNDEDKYADAPPAQILLITFAEHKRVSRKHSDENPIMRDIGRDYLSIFFRRGMDAGIFTQGDERTCGDIYWTFLMGKLLPVKKGHESRPAEEYVDEILSVFKRDQ